MDNFEPAAPVEKLFVAGLGDDVTEEALSELFSKAGKVEEVAIIKDRFTGGVKFAFVRMASVDEAKAAKESTEINGVDFGGPKPLFVDFARPPKPRDDRGGDRGGYNRGGSGGGYGGGNRFGGGGNSGGGYNRSR